VITVAVTGASGFVGGHVARRLAERGDRVLAFGRRPVPDLEGHPRVTYRSWDLTEGRIDVPPVDAVVHCAGTVTDWGPEAEFVRVNVDGTSAVLETFENARRVVHISSSSVYDPRGPKVRVREDAPYPSRYLNAYGRTKMLGEKLVRERRPDAVILRPHGVYGKGETKLLPRLLAARRLGCQIAIGDGTNHVSLTHVSNLVQAVEHAIDGVASGTFNIVDAETPTIDELLRELLAAAGLPPNVLYLPVPIAGPLAVALEVTSTLWRRPEHPLLSRYVVAQFSEEYTLDISAAVERLSYRPTIGYRDAIGEVIAGVAALSRYAVGSLRRGRRRRGA
jgi:nucleoside-diphosphate-sugar epimerase